jgi:hypothetical protein
MRRLDPEKLHVNYTAATTPAEVLLPRRYTLTHSDSTGELFLSIGRDYDNKQVSGIYTRLMRDEVLAELRNDRDGPELRVYCHISGGIVLGTARWRYTIFQKELQLVLEAIRYGDRELFEQNRELDSALVMIEFQSTNSLYNKIETWGTIDNYI